MELGVWLGEQELTDEHLLHSNVGIKTAARSICRHTDDQRFSQERLVSSTETPLKPTNAPTSHNGRSNNMVILQAVQCLKDVETTTPKRVGNALTISRLQKAEAVARAAPAVGIPPPSEAPVVGPPAAPRGGVEMMVDSNITQCCHGIRVEMYRWRPSRRGASSSNQPKSAPASAFFEESTEHWQYVSWFGTLGDPARSILAGATVSLQGDSEVGYTTDHLTPTSPVYGETSSQCWWPGQHVFHVESYDKKCGSCAGQLCSVWWASSLSTHTSRSAGSCAG